MTFVPLNLERSIKDELEPEEIHVVAGYTRFRRSDVGATNADSQTNQYRGEEILL
jgi:hypothetical protein